MDNTTASSGRGGLTGPVLQLLLLSLIVVLLAAIFWRQWGSALPLRSPSGYYAIVLNNGQGFYARIDRNAPDYLELSDLWSVKQAVNPDTKQTTAVLSRRSGEVYAPEGMVVLRASIASIEPVGAQSEVATKISAANTQAAKE